MKIVKFDVSLFLSYRSSCGCSRSYEYTDDEGFIINTVFSSVEKTKENILKEIINNLNGRISYEINRNTRHVDRVVATTTAIKHLITKNVIESANDDINITFNDIDDIDDIMEVSIDIPYSKKVDECESCAYINKYGYDKLSPSGFNEKVFSHGMATGFSSAIVKDFLECIDSLIKNPEWDLCHSDKTQNIGAYGIYSKGRVLVASNNDLWSKINTSGNRTFDITGYRATGLITEYEDYSLNEWDHTELILDNIRIVGIWVKEWYVNSPDMNKIKDYAKKNSLNIRIVKGRRD